MADSVSKLMYEDGLTLLGSFAAIFCLITTPAVIVMLISEARRNKHKALEERLLAEERAAYARRSKPEPV
jgi:hypothetical protein